MLEKLIVFVEEESAEAALQAILPKLLPETEIQILRFQGKKYMLQNLPARLRGFKSWMPEGWMLVVLVDRDREDCHALKEKLEVISRQAGIVSKSAARSGARFQIVNRIAVEELESWFFGDWEAVRTKYPRVPATIPQRERYRDPDRIPGGTWEAMDQIMQRAGYFRSGLRKIELARSVAPHMDPARNTSRSFQVFCEAVAAAKAM